MNRLNAIGLGGMAFLVIKIVAPIFAGSLYVFLRLIEFRKIKKEMGELVKSFRLAKGLSVTASILVAIGLLLLVLFIALIASVRGTISPEVIIGLVLSIGSVLVFALGIQFLLYLGANGIYQNGIIIGLTHKKWIEIKQCEISSTKKLRLFYNSGYANDYAVTGDLNEIGGLIAKAIDTTPTS